MKRIDLDDLPPKLAQLLLSVEPGEEVLLVQNGGVAGRLCGGPAVVVSEPEPEQPSNERAAEIFENFRAAIEDEF
jgi:antitoxin (DNA-binding transcriptional repressor) of toxin-antitoxin stability system